MATAGPKDDPWSAQYPYFIRLIELYCTGGPVVATNSCWKYIPTGLWLVSGLFMVVFRSTSIRMTAFFLFLPIVVLEPLCIFWKQGS